MSTWRPQSNWPHPARSTCRFSSPRAIHLIKSPRLSKNTNATRAVSCVSSSMRAPISCQLNSTASRPRLCQSRGGMHHRRPARSGRRADGRLAGFLVGLALRCVLLDALPAFVSLGLPDVLVSLVLALVPFMRNAFTHEHDEDLAAIGILVGAVQFVPAEHVVAGTQILAGHAHAPLEHDYGVPALVGMLGLDIAGGKFDLHVDPSHRLVMGEDLDLHAVRQLQNGF